MSKVVSTAKSPFFFFSVMKCGEYVKLFTCYFAKYKVGSSTWLTAQTRAMWYTVRRGLAVS